MEKIKETTTGGELVTNESEPYYSLASLFDSMAVGSKKKKVKTTEYRDVLKIPLTITIEELIEPARNAEGNIIGPDDRKSIYCKVELPFSLCEISGTVKVDCNPRDESEIQKEILLAIGRAVFRTHYKDRE